jgi:hypothetical protein
VITFAAKTTDGDPLLGIALSRENCELLLAGKPIFLNTGNMPEPMPAIYVFLMAGETDHSLLATLEINGVIREDTLQEDPQLIDPHIDCSPKGVN